jgi:hypothetical protein
MVNVHDLNFIRDKTLARDIIILDGLTGTGKTMFSPLIASLKNVQNPRFEYMLEYLLISVQLGKLENDAASALLNLLADVKFYDGLISREINFRPSDLSSVFANKKFIKYLLQLFSEDGDAVEAIIKKDPPKLFFITHQILSCLDHLKEAFGHRVRVVQMVRHPLYLIDHWMSYIDMHGNSERDFTVWLDNHDSPPAPWFSASWPDEYSKMEKIEKVLKAIETLMEPVYECMSSSDNSVLIIPFENFVLRPEGYLNNLKEFVSAGVTAQTRSVMKDQRIPREFVSAGPIKSIYKRYAFKGRNPMLSDAEEYQMKRARFVSTYGLEYSAYLDGLESRYTSTFGVSFDR